MSRGFTSMFANDLNHLIDLKISLGHSENIYLGRARQFDRYCSTEYAETEDLTEGVVLNWLKPNLGEPNSVIHSRAAFIRGFGTYFRMTYTCGLRPNEGRNLKRNEVDLNTGELRIIETKKHKSRNIVMSDEINSLAKSYAAVRDAAFPKSEFFFPSPSDRPYSAG